MIPSTLLFWLPLMGCNTIDPGATFLDGPYDAAVLDGGPFDGPVGFVSNVRSGRVVPLDLKAGRYLSDSLSAPFLPPRGIATGDQRQLGPVVPFSPNGDDITIYAVDYASGVLIEAPYILGVDEDITVATVAISEPVFEDVDGSGDSVVLENLVGRVGQSTTEDWTLSFDGELWWVTGTHSGRQGRPAEPFRPYSTDNNELNFTVSGNATVGDRITLSTDTGLIEHDLGGSVVDIHRIADQPLLVAAVYDIDTTQGWLSLFDMSTGTVRGELPLPEGAQPWRVTTGASTAELFVADAQRPAVYHTTMDLQDPSVSTIEEITTVAPLVDVAWVGDDTYSNLFVALAGLNRVDIYDLRNGQWLDVNPYDDIDGGLNIHSPVIGLGASATEIDLQQQAEWSTSSSEVNVRKKVVALTTLDGALFLMEGDTGCVVQTQVGATTVGSSSGSSYTYSGNANPSLSLSIATGEAFQTLPCGGVLLSEEWTLTYDGIAGNWEVEGSRSGIQQARAYEDQRYISDEGALTFTILSGTIPSVDGDQYSFTSDDGVLQLTSVDLGNGNFQPLEAPAPPVLFTYRSGEQGGGWDLLQEHPYALVPVLNSNRVLRVRLDTWAVEIAWD